MTNVSNPVDYRPSAFKWLLGAPVFLIAFGCLYVFGQGVTAEVHVVVGKCLLQVGLPAALIGFFAARKNRNPLL